MPIHEEQTPVLSVLEMSGKKLTVEIKPSKKCKRSQKIDENDEDNEDTEYDPPSSAEIEVFHKHPAPPLHSILKQRTVSESSEDQAYVCAEPDSPRSGGEDELSSSFNKRRSVSFNSHVDHASFKSNASVSSMAPALKRKRRRQRRHDEKTRSRNERRRHNSEGTSSNDDAHSRGSLSDSHSHSEEEVDSVGRKTGRKSNLVKSFSDPLVSESGLSFKKTIGEGGQKSSEGAEKKTEKPQQVKLSSNTLESVQLASESSSALTTTEEERLESEGVYPSIKVKDDVPKGEETVACDSPLIEDIPQVLDFRTKISESENKNVSDSVEKCDSESGERTLSVNGIGGACNLKKPSASHLKEKIETAMQNQQISCADQDSDDEADALATDFKTLNTSEGKVMNGHSKTIEVNEDERKDKIVITENSKNGCNDENATIVEDEEPVVETMLSWDDSEMNKGEHATRCALEFANSVIFDLDVD